jgi:NTP pyrophosphatase (non-canonical NTP hydrolase)
MKIQIEPQNLKIGQVFEACLKECLTADEKEIVQKGRFKLCEGFSVYYDTEFNSIGCISTSVYNFFTEISHAELVSSLVKPGEQIKAEVSPLEMHILHMLMGVCGEAGELLDALKKSIIYRRELDRENVIEELGDLEFYLEGIRQALSITREETIDGNISKLAKRYSGLSYSNKAAVERADKTSNATPQ